MSAHGPLTITVYLGLHWMAVSAVLAQERDSSLTSRLRSDQQQALELIKQNAEHLQIQLPELNIAGDPRSRHYNPNPAQQSPENLEDALLREYPAGTSASEVKLDLDTAVRLAVLHSPEYQHAVESLYLSAFDVLDARVDNGDVATANRQLETQLAQFHRFRQHFYTKVAIGDPGVGAVRSRAAHPHGIQPPGGLVGLLQQQHQLRTSRQALVSLARTLKSFEALLEAGVIDLIQVDQYRRLVEQQRGELRAAENRFRDSLDIFKVETLGLPSSLPVELDSTLIRQFQLVDSEFDVLHDQIGSAQSVLNALPEAPELQAVQRNVRNSRILSQSVQSQFNRIDEQMQRLDRVVFARERNLKENEIQWLRNDRQMLRDAIENVKRRFAAEERRLEQLREGLSTTTAQPTVIALVEGLRVLSNLARELSLIEARVRLETVYIDQVEPSAKEAIQLASKNRIDLQDKKSRVAALWDRQAGDVTESDEQPTALSRRIISRQRSGREFIADQDAMENKVRQLLRRLEGLRTNLETQRRALTVAVRQVDSTQADFGRPVPPAFPGEPAATLGPASASHLSAALTAMRDDQNELARIWLNHYAARLQFYCELGVLKLDKNGLWIEEPLVP